MNWKKNQRRGGLRMVPENDEKISLASLSELTGVPIELLKKELFFGQDLHFGETISIEEFRRAVVNYLDSTMLYMREPTQ